MPITVTTTPIRFRDGEGNYVPIDSFTYESSETIKQIKESSIDEITTLAQNTTDTLDSLNNTTLTNIANTVNGAVQTINSTMTNVTQEAESIIDQAKDAINEIDTVISSDDITKIIADNFSSEKNYQIGDYVLYIDLEDESPTKRLYRFIQPHNGSWDAEDVEEISFGEGIKNFADKEISYNAYASNTMSDDIMYFNDGAGNVPLKDFAIKLDIVQEGSGTPNVDTNVRQILSHNGVKIFQSENNLIDINMITSGIGATVSINEDECNIQTTGTELGCGANINKNDLIFPKGTYYIKLKLKTGSVVNDESIICMRKVSTDEIIEDSIINLKASFSSNSSVNTNEDEDEEEDSGEGSEEQTSSIEDINYNIKVELTEDSYFSYIGNSISTGSNYSSNITIYDLIISLIDVPYEPYNGKIYNINFEDILNSTDFWPYKTDSEGQPIERMPYRCFGIGKAIFNLTTGELIVTHKTYTFCGTASGTNIEYGTMSTKGSNQNRNIFYKSIPGASLYGRTLSTKSSLTVEEMGEDIKCSIAPMVYGSNSDYPIGAPVYIGSYIPKGQSNEVPVMQLRISFNKTLDFGGDIGIINGGTATEDIAEAVQQVNKLIYRWYNQGTPLQYLFPLETPLIYKINPIEIRTFEGENSIIVNTLNQKREGKSSNDTDISLLTTYSAPELTYYISPNAQADLYNQAFENTTTLNIEDNESIEINNGYEGTKLIEKSEKLTVYSRNMYRANLQSRTSNNVIFKVSEDDPNTVYFTTTIANNIKEGYSDAKISKANAANILEPGRYYVTIYDDINEKAHGIRKNRPYYLYYNVIDFESGAETITKATYNVNILDISAKSYVSVRLFIKANVGIINNRKVSIYISKFPPLPQYIPYKTPSNTTMYENAVVEGTPGTLKYYSKPVDTTPKEISIATFNVGSYNLGDVLYSYADLEDAEKNHDKLKEYRDFIRSLNPNILCTQEDRAKCDVDEYVYDKIQGKMYPYMTIPSYSSSSELYNFAKGIYSDYPLSPGGAYTFKNLYYIRETDNNDNVTGITGTSWRSFSYAFLYINNKTILLISTHLAAHRDGMDDITYNGTQYYGQGTVRRKQAEEMRDFINKSRCNYVIICGDFNVWGLTDEGSKGIIQYYKGEYDIFTDETQNNLKYVIANSDNFTGASYQDPPFTENIVITDGYEDEYGYFDTWRNDTLTIGHRFDNILVSDNIKMRNVHVVYHGLKDHNPLFATLIID